RQAHIGDGLLDGFLGNPRQGGGEAVGQGLAPQQEAAPHHFEEKALVRYIHGGPLPPDAADHGGGHLGSGEKLLRRHVEQQLRLHVVLEEQGEGAALRGALWGAQPPGYLPLDHHREGSKAGGLHQLFQNGRGDVVGQVGADYRREALELLCRDGREVQFQHVPRHDLHIRIGGHGLRQHRQQGPVQLHGHHLPGPLGQLRRQGADARADLQHAAACVRAGSL
ncbi:Hydrolase, partial [Dysosmobacter welbionis]